MSDHLTEFSQQRYDYEAARRGELTGAIALPIGVLSVLGSALIAVLKDLRLPLEAADVVLLVSAMLSLAAGLIAAFFLACSYFGYTYRYVATPKEVREYYTKVKAAYLGAGVNEQWAADYADRKVRDYLQERYAESAHHNTLNNDRKSYFLYLASGGMIVALLPAVFAGCAFLYKSVHSAPATTRVEIVNTTNAQSEAVSDGKRTSESSTCSTTTSSASTGPDTAGSTARPNGQTTAPASPRPDAAGTTSGSVNHGVSGPN